MGASPSAVASWQEVPEGAGEGGGIAAASDSDVIAMSGDIEAFLAGSQYGEANDGRWLLPDATEMHTFSVAMRLLIAGDLERAARAAAMIGFQVIEYTDPEWGIFYVLRDIPDTEGVSRGGTYVRNPRARFPVVVEVPHPAHEQNTQLQGIQLFFDARAALLLIAGTHRRSDPEPSTCDGVVENDYRRSDPSHAVEHLFHVAHVQAELTLSEPLFIQLHGFGTSAYQRLKAQCRHRTRGKDPRLLVNVSEAFHDPEDPGANAPGAGSFTRLLADLMNREGTIKACVYNEDTTIYGGTLNTQGRFTNGSRDPCRASATASSGRFVHLEQSQNVRMHRLELLVSLLARAIEAYYTGEG